MKKVALFSVLLLVGLIGSQILPSLLGQWEWLGSEMITFLTMVGLSFIMIHVGYEFELNKRNLRSYG